MRIALLGAGGMLATALARAWSDEQLFPLTKAACDISDETVLQRTFQRLQPDVVINAAAITDVDGCEAKPEPAMAINGTAVGTIARIAKPRGAIVIHFSTDYVFSGQQRAGYAEDDPSGPLNVYGRSKELGERLLLASGVKAYLIRTAWLYGPKGRNFVETMLRLADEKRSVRVVTDQVGAPTFTHDLAESVRQLLEERLPFGIYHRTNSGSVSWYDFTKEIYRLTGKNTIVEGVRSAEFPRPARRPAWSILRTTKLPPLRPWPEALKAYLHLTHRL